MSWDAVVASRYIWQGFDYSDGRPVLQPGVVVSANHLSAILWLNHDLETGQSDEVDFFLQYDRSIDRLSVAAGYARFEYPYRDGWAPSQELYADFGYDVPLQPTLSVHYDFDAGDGTYAALGVSHEVATPVSPVFLASNLFYHSSYYDATGFSAIEFSLSVEQAVGPFAITPAASYFATWDNGDYTGELAIPSNWLFSLKVGQGF